jgi:hypothetical protein
MENNPSVANKIKKNQLFKMNKHQLLKDPHFTKNIVFTAILSL